ncbi:MAG TPA: CHRD domain-containing protein [Nitrososphaeraceae archaeon]|nr:CHRD domain-containing protein [Nitrososphaeraceae archaeon]
MNTKCKVFAIVSNLTIIITSSVSIIGVPSSAFAQQLQQMQQEQRHKFTAILTGSEEVPPKSNIKATGAAEFLPSINRTMLDYTVNTTNLDNVTTGHIHLGKTGENGPVLVTLFESATPFVLRAIGGWYLVAQGNLTSSDLQGPLASKQISDLVNIMKNVQAYVDLHTYQNPDGEVRGQIISGT